MTTAGLSPAAPRNGRGFLLRFCTKNPFYAISAALVLLGLWVSFGAQDQELETWLLMGGLTGYTLLLAGTAVALVRYLNLWDDARTVMLLVVFMFLATSVTFDHVLVNDPRRGRTCYLLGLAFAVLISEAIIRSVRLLLPALYRRSYYLILAVFFLYPIFVRELLEPGQPLQPPVMWALFGFSTAAGLAFLTLLPAVRRGAEAIQTNDPQLPWPLYPWSLFAMLAIAVPGRALLMCWSLHSPGAAMYDRLVFAPFFLVPFGFALAVLLLEMGLREGKATVVRVALAAPVPLFIMGLVGHSPADPVYRLLRVLTTPLGKLPAFGAVRTDPDPLYQEFLRLFSSTFGADPLFVTLLLCAAYYVYAALRRVPWALEGLSVAIAAMGLVATNSIEGGMLLPQEPGPFVVAGVLQLVLGVVRGNVWNQLFAGLFLSAALAVGVPLPEWRGLRTGVFMHLVVLSLLLLGALHADAIGAYLRRIGAFWAMLFALAAMTGVMRFPDPVLPWAPIAYSVALGILLAAYGQLLRDPYVLIMATLILGYWVFKFGWTAYRAARMLVRGLDYFVPGLAFFVIAWLVSLAKAGVLRRWFESRWGELPPWLLLLFAPPANAAASTVVPSPEPPAPENPPA